jgi:3-oxoacid CoA-transferase
MYTLTRLTVRACARPLYARALGQRLYATAGANGVPKTRKVFDSADDAVADLKSGSVILSGGPSALSRLVSTTLTREGPGFGICGTPDTLIAAIARREDLRDLTAVSNNAGVGEMGLGKLLHSGQITKMIASYIGGHAFAHSSAYNGLMGGTGTSSSSSSTSRA